MKSFDNFKTKAEFEQFLKDFESWEDAKDKLRELLSSEEGPKVRGKIENLIAIEVTNPLVYLAVINAADVALERFNVGELTELECQHSECLVLIRKVATEMLIALGGNWTEYKAKVAAWLYMGLLEGNKGDINILKFFHVLQAGKFFLKEYCDYRQKQHHHGG